MRNNMYDSVGLAVAAFLPFLLLHCAVANTVHVVGDSSGWTIPPNQNQSFYSAWASSQQFQLNDVLTFNFATGAHDVVEVPKESYDSCSSANNKSTITNGPATVTLSTAGAHYYICSFGQHCQNGQKLSISVSSTSSPSASPSPSPSSTPTPMGPAAAAPPPPSSAPRVFAGFCLVLFSFALGKMVF